MTNLVEEMGSHRRRPWRESCCVNGCYCGLGRSLLTSCELFLSGPSMGVIPLAIHARNALAACCASLALFTFSRRPNTWAAGAVGLPQHTLPNKRERPALWSGQIRPRGPGCELASVSQSQSCTNKRAFSLRVPFPARVEYADCSRKRDWDRNLVLMIPLSRHESRDESQ